jgi:acyl carrier protein
VDVECSVLEIIARKAKVEPAALNRATEISALNLDAMDMLETVFEIEEQFDISVAYNANEASSRDTGFNTVGDVVDLLTRELNGKNLSHMKSEDRKNKACFVMVPGVRSDRSVPA